MDADFPRRHSLETYLKAHDLLPKRSLGQVFLCDPKVVDAILRDLRLQADDTIIELGAGPGFLTKVLAERARRVIAVEIDRRFEPLHEALFDGMDRPPTMIYDDARTAALPDLERSPGGRLLVFGNLPYYVTTELILNALTRWPSMDRALFMVEDGVRERLDAEPGTKAYGTLSIATQLFGTWTCERIVARRSFYPVPNVTSALVSLTPSRDVRAKQTAADPAFQRFVVRLFQYRRKSLKNALTHATSLPADRIERLASMGTSEGESAPCRAETLSPDSMKELFESVADMAPAFVSTLRIQ